MAIGDIALLISALGIGGIVTKLVEKIIDQRRGRIQAEQTAWDQRDAEARKRRLLEETLHDTRECLRRAGVAYEDMPAWPSHTRSISKGEK